MAEQIHPITGEPLSVSPLTWSHAAFVSRVERYLPSRPPARSRALGRTTLSHSAQRPQPARPVV